MGISYSDIGGTAGSGDNTGFVPEDLETIASNISHSKAWLASTLKKTPMTDVSKYWVIDTYADPADNAKADGVAFDDANTLADRRSRVHNFAQLFEVPIRVTNTSRRVNSVGESSDNYIHQYNHAIVQIMRDLELALLTQSPTGTKNSGSGTSQNRHMGSLGSWIQTNGETSATRPAGTITVHARNQDTGAVTTTTAANTGSANGSTLHTGGTARDLTADLINLNLQQVFTAGQGMPTLAYMSPSLKTGFSAALAASNGGIIRRDVMNDDKVNIAFNVLMTDFGYEITAMANDVFAKDPNTSQETAGTVMILDTDTIELGVLGELEENEIGQVGDSTQSQLVCEKTLIVRNEAASVIMRRLQNVA